MPAMSPTMTEGNIVSWKINEGDSFWTGDVLLEVETDKAQMEVEAQDDGKLAKIMHQAGTKGVRVGSQIAIIAEPEDDLHDLSVPDDKLAPIQSSQNGSQSSINPSQSYGAETGSLPSSRSENAASPQTSEKHAPVRSLENPQTQRYPLYPSVVQLLREKNIPESEVDKIPPSGPKGRLLKGDVLAHIGRIPSSYSSNQSARISKLGRLDLSHVKPFHPKDASFQLPTQGFSQQTVGPDIINTEVAIHISLSSVLSVQKRIQAALGITLPLSTFVARATELANDGLPRLSTDKPTADELFNDVLGLNEINLRTSKGGYIPQMTALPAQRLGQSVNLPEQPDVYDILTGNVSRPESRVELPPVGTTAGSKTDDTINVFSTTAAKGEEKRARVFLERVKTILQAEPGRLIL